jgi:hypothetical protein
MRDPAIITLVFKKTYIFCHFFYKILQKILIFNLKLFFLVFFIRFFNLKFLCCTIFYVQDFTKTRFETRFY